MKKWRIIVLTSGIASAIAVTVILIAMQTPPVRATVIVAVATCTSVTGSVVGWLARRDELQSRGFRW